MNYDFHLQIPEDSAEGMAISSLIARAHVSPEEAARRLLAQSAQKRKRTAKKAGDIWDRFADGAEVLDQIGRDSTQPVDPGSSASIALLRAWIAEAPKDPAAIREAEEDLREFKRNMNLPRKESATRLHYPDAE